MKSPVPIRSVFTIALLFAAVAAAVSCGDGEGITPPPTTGTLEISTTSDGTDVDADGYSVQVDGGTAQAIPASGTLTIDEVTLGTHSVVLGGLAPNCAVSGENPQSIEVTPGDTSIVAFVVTCRPPTGRLVITSVTGGISPDPDGYTISVGGVPGSPIGANEVVTIDEVPAGTHVVELSGIADNCTVADGPSRTVTVVNGADAAVQFDVTCIAITGTIEVLTATAGSSLDPDGYLISLDGSEAQPIGVNATLRLEALEPGPHVVGLSGQAHNCRLEGENPRPVQLVAGTTTLTFSVTCLGADAMIAFGSNTFDLAAIFVVRPDGSGLTNLTPAGEFERNPVWSPDGSKILFVREDDLYVMHADGSGRVLIAADIGEASGHSWSPDGTLIAFTPSGFRGDEFIQELWVMGADGNHPRRLAANGSTPSWSPDSRRIAYEGDGQIRAINVDGTGGRRLTDQQFGASQPAWSPAGDRIAFLTAIDDPPDRPANRHIFLMNADGSAPQNLSRGRGDDDRPIWSPDGSKIAFLVSEGGDGSEVAVMNADGSGRTNLTRRPGFDFDPAWSPEGSRIVFSRSEDDGSDIYVMNADGTSQMNVSNLPDAEESAPSWGGQGAQSAAGRRSLAFNRWLRAQAEKNHEK